MGIPPGAGAAVPPVATGVPPGVGVPEGLPPVPTGAGTAVPPVATGVPPGVGVPEGLPPVPEGLPPVPTGAGTAVPPVGTGVPPGVGVPEGLPPVPEGTPPRTCGVRAGRRGAGLVRAVTLLLFVAPVEAHRVVFDREGAANARGGMENNVHALDHRGTDALFLLHALSAAQRGAERTEIAEADAASLLEAVDDLDLEGIDHGFDVGRSEGTFLFDALDDFGAVVSRCGDELRVEEDVAGLDVLAANNVVG